MSVNQSRMNWMSCSDTIAITSDFDVPGDAILSTVAIAPFRS